MYNNDKHTTISYDENVAIPNFAAVKMVYNNDLNANSLNFISKFYTSLGNTSFIFVSTPLQSAFSLSVPFVSHY